MACNTSKNAQSEVVNTETTEANETEVVKETDMMRGLDAEDINPEYTNRQIQEQRERKMQERIAPLPPMEPEEDEIDVEAVAAKHAERLRKIKERRAKQLQEQEKTE